MVSYSSSFFADCKNEHTDCRCIRIYPYGSTWDWWRKDSQRISWSKRGMHLSRLLEIFPYSSNLEIFGTSLWVGSTKFIHFLTFSCWLTFYLSMSHLLKFEVGHLIIKTQTLGLVVWYQALWWWPFFILWPPWLPELHFWLLPELHSFRFSLSLNRFWLQRKKGQISIRFISDNGHKSI